MPQRMPDLSAGLCVGRLREFEDINTRTAHRAIQICRSGCPVLQACADWGLHHERWGCWGGMADRTLTQERKRRKIRLEEPRYSVLAPRQSAGRAAA